MTTVNDAERAGVEDWFEREAVARAICEACEESPDHQGDAQGNEYRWQDYLPVADAAISAWQRTQTAGVPEAKVTGAWESARIGDFNAGWNACRDSVVTLMKKAAYMELDTTKRSIAIQDELRALPAAATATPAAQGAVPDVSAMARVLSDRAADACCVDPDDNWKIYGQEYIEDVRAILAQPAQPTVQGEAVEVVGMRIRTDGFGSYIADFAMGVPAAMPGEVREQLMTVAQHQRIMAAAVPAGCKAVPVYLIERTICRLTHGHEHDKAVRELRALLASAEGGER